jgi:hypothetical protein
MEVEEEAVVQEDFQLELEELGLVNSIQLVAYH